MQTATPSNLLSLTNSNCKTLDLLTIALAKTAEAQQAGGDFSRAKLDANGHTKQFTILGQLQLENTRYKRLREPGTMLKEHREGAFGDKGRTYCLCAKFAIEHTRVP